MRSTPSSVSPARAKAPSIAVRCIRLSAFSYDFSPHLSSESTISNKPPNAPASSFGPTMVHDEAIYAPRSNIKLLLPTLTPPP